MPEGRGLFEVARERIRTRHLAFRTEQAYLQWMRRYVRFHGRRHPRDMGAAEVEAFLTHLAVEAKVGASTQNQALQGLLFLYKQVLDIELPWLGNVTRASRLKRRPVPAAISVAAGHYIIRWGRAPLRIAFGANHTSPGAAYSVIRRLWLY
jgi:hypothetical protein